MSLNVPHAKREHPWGKLRLGQTWIAVAHDFGRILSVMKLGDYERMLIWAIQEHSWNHVDRARRAHVRWPDAKPFDRSMYALARQMEPDTDKTANLTRKLSKARHDLMNDGVIVEKDEGLLIEVDIESWKGDRITPTQIAYARSSQTRSTLKKESEDLESFADPIDESDIDFSPPQRTKSSPPQRTTWSSPEDHLVLPRGPFSPPQRTKQVSAIEDRGREFKVLEYLDEDADAGAAAAEQIEPPQIPPESDAEDDDATWEANQVEAKKQLDLAQTSRKPSPIFPRSATTDPDRVELGLVADLCDRYFVGHDGIRKLVSTRHGDYPIAWYRAAMERLRACEKDQWTNRYFLGILGGFARDGGPTPSKSPGRHPPRAPIESDDYLPDPPPGSPWSK